MHESSIHESHFDYKDEDYEVEFNIDLEPHLTDLLPHPPMRCNDAQARPSGKYEDEDYDVEFKVNLEPSLVDVMPSPNADRDNLSIQVTALAFFGAMVAARKLSSPAR